MESAEAVVPVAAPVAASAPPAEISFGNRTAVRAGFFAALLAVLAVTFSAPYVPILWPVISTLAGFFAVFIYLRGSRQRLSLLSGARIGWITGIFMFVICIIDLTISVVTSSGDQGIINQLQKSIHQQAMNPEVGKLIQQPGFVATVMLLLLFVLFIMLTLLPTLGGLLGAKFLTRQQQS